MRARFFAPTDEAETARHLDFTRQADAFWQFFVAEIPHSPARSREVLRRLQAVHAGLGCEWGPSEGLAAPFVVRPLRRELTPLAELAVARAPKLSRWHFTTQRGRVPLPEALARVRQETDVDLQHAVLRAGVARGHLLELVLKSGQFAVADEPHAVAACERLVELLLGDETYRNWIGTIRTVPGPKGGPLRVIAKEPEAFHPLADLTRVIDSGALGVQAGLDERPYHRFCEHAEWTLLDVEPISNPGPCSRQDDLALCSTLLPEMLKCYLQGEPFASVRFSRHGEVFVYLKYQSQLGSSEARLAERQGLEDMLNRALVPGAVGCVVGGGLGLQYSYVDLALANLEHGLHLSRQVFLHSGIKGPAWVLFCDSSLSQEWVGLSESAAPPPGFASSLASA